MLPETINGSAPMRPEIIHVIVTIKKPSLVKSLISAYADDIEAAFRSNFGNQCDDFGRADIKTDNEFLIFPTHGLPLLSVAATAPTRNTNPFK